MAEDYLIANPNQRTASAPLYDPNREGGVLANRTSKKTGGDPTLSSQFTSVQGDPKLEKSEQFVGANRFADKASSLINSGPRSHGDLANIPQEFRAIFEALPTDLALPDRFIESYYQAYQLVDSDKQVDFREIADVLQQLTKRTDYLERRYNHHVDKGPLFYQSLGHLINGDAKAAKKLGYDLDTIAFQYAQIKDLSAVQDLDTEIQEATSRLQSKQNKQLGMLREIGGLVHQNTSLPTHEYKDSFDHIPEQVQDLSDRLFVLNEEIGERRTRISSLEAKRLQYQKNAVKNGYKVLLNQKASSKEVDQLLASVSLHPELMLGDKNFAAKVGAARARVAARAEKGSIEEALYTDSTQALQRVVKAYNQKAGLLSTAAAFEAIEKTGLDKNYYSVEQLFGIDESTLPNEIQEHLYSEDGLVPVLARGDGKQVSNWVLVKREQNGAMTIKPISLPFPSDTDSFNIVDGGGPSPFNRLKLLLSPITLTPSKLQAWRLEQASHRTSLVRVLSTNSSFKKLKKIGEELSVHLEQLQSLMIEGQAGFTKEQGFLEVLQTQAQNISDFYLQHHAEMSQAAEGVEEVLAAVGSLEMGRYGDGFEKSLREELANLKSIQELIRSEKVLELCDSIMELDADFDKQKVEHFLKTDGLVIVAAVAAGVAAMTVVGAVFSPAIFAGIGGMALAAGVMGLGSVPGQELGLYASGEFFDTGLKSNFQLYQEGKITKDELTDGYMRTWFTSAATTFAFMGAGKIAGYALGRAALSTNAATASTGQTVVQMGRFVDKALNKFFTPKTRIGHFFRKVVEENIEEAFENAAQEINPALGSFVTMLNCLDGRNIEIQLAPAQVTIAGQSLVGNELAMNFHYAAGKQSILLEKINGLYENAQVTEIAPYTYKVQIKQGSKTVTQVFSPSQDPYILRRSVTDQIHDNYDGTISYENYLSDVLGFERVGSENEFRVTEDTDLTWMESQLKSKGMVVVSRNGSDSDSSIVVAMGPQLVKIHTTKGPAVAKAESVGHVTLDVKASGKAAHDVAELSYQLQLGGGTLFGGKPRLVTPEKFTLEHGPIIVPDAASVPPTIADQPRVHATVGGEMGRSHPLPQQSMAMSASNNLSRETASNATTNYEVIGASVSDQEARIRPSPLTRELSRAIADKVTGNRKSPAGKSLTQLLLRSLSTGKVTQEKLEDVWALLKQGGGNGRVNKFLSELGSTIIYVERAEGDAVYSPTVQERSDLGETSWHRQDEIEISEDTDVTPIVDNNTPEKVSEFFDEDSHQNPLEHHGTVAGEEERAAEERQLPGNWERHMNHLVDRFNGDVQRSRLDQLAHAEIESLLEKHFGGTDNYSPDKLNVLRNDLKSVQQQVLKFEKNLALVTEWNQRFYEIEFRAEGTEKKGLENTLRDEILSEITPEDIKNLKESDLTTRAELADFVKKGLESDASITIPTLIEGVISARLRNNWFHQVDEAYNEATDNARKAISSLYQSLAEAQVVHKNFNPETVRNKLRTTIHHPDLLSHLEYVNLNNPEFSFLGVSPDKLVSMDIDIKGPEALNRLIKQLEGQGWAIARGRGAEEGKLFVELPNPKGVHPLDIIMNVHDVSVLQWKARETILMNELGKIQVPEAKGALRQQLLERLGQEGLTRANVKEIAPMTRRLGLRVPHDGNDTNIHVTPTKPPPVKSRGWSPPPERERVIVNPQDLHFSQLSIASLIGPREQMKANGALDPLIVVRNPNGQLISYDNSRLEYALENGMNELEIVVFEHDEVPSPKLRGPLYRSEIKRLNEYYSDNNIPQQIDSDQKIRPRTWGEAMLIRLLNNNLPVDGTKERPIIKFSSD